MQLLFFFFSLSFKNQCSGDYTGVVSTKVIPAFQLVQGIILDLFDGRILVSLGLSLAVCVLRRCGVWDLLSCSHSSYRSLYLLSVWLPLRLL